MRTLDLFLLVLQLWSYNRTHHSVALWVYANSPHKRHTLHLYRESIYEEGWLSDTTIRSLSHCGSKYAKANKIKEQRVLWKGTKFLNITRVKSISFFGKKSISSYHFRLLWRAAAAAAQPNQAAVRLLQKIQNRQAAGTGAAAAAIANATFICWMFFRIRPMRLPAASLGGEQKCCIRADSHAH